MHLRRYYKKGHKYKYMITDDELYEIKRLKGQVEADNIDNAHYDLILDNEEEMRDWLKQSCNKILKDPLYYFHNLEKLTTFNTRITKKE
jgi:hypothetical protein